MGNQFRVEVHESPEELQHRRSYAGTGTTKERIQMLYSIKIQGNTTLQELAHRLGRHESTVYRWLQRYKQGGIDALLEVKTAPVKPALIPQKLMNQLRERLSQPQGFNSYDQIQEWLTLECQVVVAYQTVHKIVPAQAECQIESTPSTEC